MTPSEVEKEFEEAWSKHHDDELCNSNPILKLVSHWYYFEGHSRQQKKIEKLKEGIREVLDGTLPYLAEQRLKKLLDETLSHEGG